MKIDMLNKLSTINQKNNQDKNTEDIFLSVFDNQLKQVDVIEKFIEIKNDDNVEFKEDEVLEKDTLDIEELLSEMMILIDKNFSENKKISGETKDQFISKEQFIKEIKGLLEDTIQIDFENSTDKVNISNVIPQNFERKIYNTENIAVLNLESTKNLLEEKKQGELSNIEQLIKENSNKSSLDIFLDRFKMFNQSRKHIEKSPNEKNITNKLDIILKNSINIENNYQQNVIQQYRTISNEDTLLKSIAFPLVNSKILNSENDFEKKSSNNVIVDLELMNNEKFSVSNDDKTIKELPIKTIRKEYFHNDVLEAIKYIKSKDLQEIRVKISPKELGDITIKFLKTENEHRFIITLSNDDTFVLMKNNINEIQKHLISTDANSKQITVDINNKGDFSQDRSQQFNHNSKEKQREKNNKIINNRKGKVLLEDANINLLI